MRMSLNPFRGARKKHEDPELNLIPMIDIMSVMVAFLLIYSTEVEVVQNAKDVEIPLSTAEAKPAETVVVTITRDTLLVQGDVVATMEQIRDPDRIWPGQVFSVPDTSKEGEPADMKQLGEQAVKVVPYNG